ncbi:Nuclear cap-binding protein subunit 1 [Terramyces sp. JEL0728]|nr:Nuclear cap-binding protein subunit 1 [Terramyces sp. JEL0728]
MNRERGYKSYKKRYSSSGQYQEDPVIMKSPEEEQNERIVNLFFKIGDKHQPQEHLEHLADLLEKEYQPRDIFIKSWKSCLPISFNISLYGTLTGILNARNFDIGQDMIVAAAELLNAGLESSSFRQIKLVIRYFAECVNAGVILPGQLIGLFDTFLAVASEINVNQERADAFVYVVMAAIPWAAVQLRDRNLMELERIMGELQNYMAQRAENVNASGISAANSALLVYRDCVEGEPYEAVDKLTLLWEQTLNLKNSNWETPILPKYNEKFAEANSRQIPHDIPAITIPTSVTQVKFLYQTKFWIFDDNVNAPGNKKICNLPSTTLLSRHILEDSIIDIIRMFSLNHKECALILLNTEQYFNTSYIEQQGIQVYEAVIEAIFQEMFRLPKCHERFVYYSTLVIDLCKESLDKIPSVLGRSIKLLFARLDSENGAGGMDVECIKRFSEFFARHLSNFGFSWKWSDWEYVLDADPTCGKFVFVRETLHNCVRLAYYDRIKNSIPETFELQGQIFATSAPGFLFSFQESDIVADDNLFDLIRELNSKISHRDDANLIEEVLKSIDSYIAENPSNFAERFIGKTSYENAHEAFLQCIMYQGSKSFSHLLGVIERYLPLLQKINETEEHQLLTTKVTHAFWENNPQFLEIILTKLVNYKVIEAKAIFTWLLSAENLEKNCTKFFVWNILSTTLNKLTVRVQQITLRLEKKSPSDEMMNDDIQESVASLEGALEAAQKERKDTIIHCMQKFVEILSGIGAEDVVYWRWTSGLFRQMTREFQVEIDKLKFTLDGVVFGSVIDDRILAIWNAAKAVYELHVFYRNYISLKLQYDEYALKRTKLSKIEMRSVIVFGIPKELRNEVNLSIFFNNLQVGKVENVVLCRNWSLLQQAVQKRLYYLEKLEKLCLKLDGLPKLERSIAIPTATFRGQVTAVEVAVEEIMSRYNSIEPSYRPTHKPGVWGLFGEAVDSTQNYVANFKHWDSMVEKFRKNPHLSAATSIGIVSFESPISATIVSQAVSHMDPFSCIVKNAPEPRDIYWQNLSSKAAHSYTKLLRMVFVMSVMSYFFYQLWNVVLVIPFANFIYEIILWNPQKVIEKLGQMLPKVTLFNLVRDYPHQSNHFTEHCDFASPIATCGSVIFDVDVFIIGTMYFSIQPLILPFCTLFFATAYFIYKYLLMYVHIPLYESKGVATPYVVNRCLAGLAIMQLSMMGVLALKSAEDSSFSATANPGSAESLSAYAQMVIGVIPLLCITFFTHKLLSDAYEKQIRNIPLEIIGKAIRSFGKSDEETELNHGQSSYQISPPELLFEQELAGIDRLPQRKLKNRLSSFSLSRSHQQDQVHINLSDDSSSGDEVLPSKRFSTFSIIQPNTDFNPFHDPSEVNPVLDANPNAGYLPVNNGVDTNTMQRHIEPPMTRVSGILDVPLESAMLRYGEESDNTAVDDAEEDAQLHSYMHPALIGKLPLPWIEGNNFESLRKGQGKLQKALLHRLKYQQRLSIEEADPEIEAEERNLLGRMNVFFDGMTSWLNLAVS